MPNCDLSVNGRKGRVRVGIVDAERISLSPPIKKLIGLWINGFTSFSVKPLRIATFLGVVCAAIGFLFGIYVVLNKLFLNPSAPMGYSSIMAVLVFLGGMILMMLGLIGEYIGRIYISLNNSPQAVIRQTVNIGNKDGK